MSLRIAVVAPPFYELPPRGYGGTELVCHLLAEALVVTGHEVALVGAGPGRTRARFLPTFSEAQPEWGEDAGMAEAVHAVRAAELVSGFAPDVVHDHTRLGPLLARPPAAPPIVLTAHCATAGPESGVDWLAAVRDRAYLVAISAAQRRLAPALAWRATVHNGIAVDAYPFSADKDEYMLYLGRVSQTKGVHDAIAAARACRRRLVIAGTWTIDEERRYLDVEIRPLLGPDVTFLGEVDFAAKVDLLRRAACLVLPIRWHEPFGLVLVEAMACGTPIAAVSRGAVPEIVIDGVTGALCPSPDGLADAVQRAVGRDPHACRAHVEAHFTAARMAAGYEDVYRAALADR
jgi:glycosyltransferase involved in cell wall biosynthesis